MMATINKSSNIYVLICQHHEKREKTLNIINLVFENAVVKIYLGFQKMLTERTPNVYDINWLSILYSDLSELKLRGLGYPCHVLFIV